MATAYAPAPSGGREKIRFEYGRPEILALQFTTGRSVAGRFGDQVMYTTTDDRIFFLDVEDAEAVETSVADMQIAAGEPFQLTKVRYPRGEGHGFEVRRMSAPLNTRRPAASTTGQSYTERVQPRVPDPPTPFDAPDELSDQLARSVRIAQQGARPRAPIAIEDERRRLAPPAVSKESLQTADDLAPEAELIYQSFVPAIDAIAKVQKYAEARGLRLSFGEEDVRAVAITHYINRFGGRR